MISKEDRESRSEKMRMVCSEAGEFLKTIAPVSDKELERYFNIQKTYTTKSDILYRLFYSLQNRNMLPKVIGFGTNEKKDAFRKIFHDYDDGAILKEYGTTDDLLERFVEEFVLKDKIKNSKRNSWYIYAKAVMSACSFMENFEDADAFTKFVESFSCNEFSSAALPMLLSKEIYGLGFATACDFLKELGFDHYPKPDRHIIDIFSALGLCEEDDYSSYKAVIEMAQAVKSTPYNVDKTFWLIASGNYYLHDIKIASHKEDFYEQNALNLHN